jgi:hypothetical protein
MRLQILKKSLLLASWFTVLPKDLLPLTLHPHIPMELAKNKKMQLSWFQAHAEKLPCLAFSYQAELFVSNQQLHG